MRKILLFLTAVLLASCNNGESREEVARDLEKQTDSIKTPTNEEIAENLKEEGYEVFTYKEGDTTYLMQQYYMVFLKSGANRSQDSTEAAAIQEKHMQHLTRMYEEGFTSLTGPMGDDGDLRGIVIYNTKTQAEADSLAKLDPAVQAGRLEVEVHPWWVAKGGKLN